MNEARSRGSERFQARIFPGALWTLGASWLRILALLIAYLFVARLIGPETLGMNAMAGSLASVFRVLVGPAMGEVLIQRSDAPPSAFTAWFWTLQLWGLVLFGALVALREPFAALYGEPAVAPLIAMYALVVPLAALQTVPEAWLFRRFQFRAYAFATGVGAVLGAVAGVAFAAGGRGPWALVAMQIGQTLATVILVWRAAGWRPVALPAWSWLGAFGRYSASTAGMRLIAELDEQVLRVIIGATLGPQALAFYSVPRRLFELLRDALVVPFVTVGLPALAGARAATQDVAAVFRATLRAAMGVANPAFLGLFILAPYLIPVAVGPSWEPAVPVLQVFALVGLMVPRTAMNGAALRAAGKPEWQVGLTSFGAFVSFAAVSSVASYGLVAVAFAILLRGIAVWAIGARLVERVGTARAREQLVVGLPSFAASLVMVVATGFLLHAVAAHSLPALLPAVGVVVGVVLYGAAYLVIAPLEARHTIDAGRRIFTRTGGP